jgi:hypothetical protein
MFITFFFISTDALKQIGNQMITNSCRIYFGFKDDMQNIPALTFSYDVAFASPKHDVVILELAEDQKMLPEPLQLTNINIPCGKLHVIGHPARMKLRHDPGCKVINDQEELTKVVKKGIDYFSGQGSNRQEVQDDYSHCKLSDDRILFHCSKSTAHGASGSPLIVVNDIPSRNEKTVQATGMLLRGFPPAYYNKSTEEEAPPDVLIESGISMEKIKSLLEEHSLHRLANELFA